MKLLRLLKQTGFNYGTATFCKAFKISGVVGGKTEQRVEYTSLLSQIDEGKKKCYEMKKLHLALGGQSMVCVKRVFKSSTRIFSL